MRDFKSKIDANPVLECKPKTIVNVFKGRYFEWKGVKDKQLSIRIIKKDILKTLDYICVI